MEKFFNTLAGFGMSMVAGVCLLLSFIAWLADYSLPFDPAWLTIVISGLPLAYLAIKRLLLEKSISSALLITIAMLAAIAIGEIFAAAEVAFIMAIGAILEDKTVERAKKGLHKLITLVPQQARRQNKAAGNGGEQVVAIDAIKPGDILRVLPGETIPVDGQIVKGHTSIDQAVMTGESLPVDKSEGDLVFSGSINLYGTIEFKASKLGQDSSLQKLVRMISQAEENKGPTQRIVDKWASWLVPIALAIALATYFIMDDVVRAVTVLVVFCPCALVLATPTSIMAAIGQAARHGVIIKSGEALEKMGQIDCLAFDKTGTLTSGVLSVGQVLSFNSQWPQAKLLTLAASVEALSEHPLAKAIVGQARLQKLTLASASSFKMSPGKGIRAMVNGYKVHCGSLSYLQENGIAVGPDEQAALHHLAGQGKASTLVAVNGQLAG